MHSSVKLIPPEQVEDDGLNAVSKERKHLDNRKKKDNSRNISSDDDELDKIKKHSRKRMWYSSDENSSSESDRDEKKQMRKGKKIRDDSSSDYSAERSKRKTRFRSGKEEYTFEEGFPSSASDGNGSDCKGRRQKSTGRDGDGKDIIKGEVTNFARKEMGLDWMLKSESKKPPVSETKEILAEHVPVEEEVFEAHMTQYQETQHQSTDRSSQDPTKERRVEYDNWVEVSGSKSGSFNTSYTDSSPSSSGSTAHSTCPSAKQSHLVQDLGRQLSELKRQIQELQQEGKRSEERWQQFLVMHQQQQPHPFNPIPLFYPPPPYQHNIAFQPGANMPLPSYQQQPQQFIPIPPPLFYPPPSYQHYVGFQQGAYMPPPSYQQQYDTNQSGGASRTSMPNYFLSPPQVFPGMTTRPAVVNQPPT